MRPIAPALALLTTAPLPAFAQSSPSIDDVTSRPATSPIVAAPSTVPAASPSPSPAAGVSANAVVAPRAPTTPTAARGAWPPLASWHNDVFYIASPDQNWFVAPTGRLQVDGYLYTPFSATHDYTTPSGEYRRPDLMNTILLRRARIEVMGGFLRWFTFFLGGELGSAGTPIATDLIFNARVHPLLNAQLGQFDAPFTMENRTSDKYLDFLERSMAVRALGVPTNKEIGLMLWGEMPSRLFYYSIGVFNGDGQNRLNRDNYFDGIGRIFAHPFILMRGPLANLQIGGSFRAGWRGPSVDYPYPSMTTQGGWAFFNAAIAGGANPLTIVPEALQLGFAGEIEVPIRRFDLRGEVIWIRNGTAEMAAAPSDAPRLAGPAQRLGMLTGLGGYVQVGYWLFGDVEVNGRPGYENPVALNLDRADRAALPLGIQLITRFDVVHALYEGSSRSDPHATPAAADGVYEVYGAEFGANLWWTRHVRFSLNYMQYFFPNRRDGAGAPLPAENHAIGPHGAESSFGELSARVGLVL
jgi:hypothetical protein